MNVKKRRVTGFTLIELLVVITIIGMLMALLLPAVNNAVEAARCIQCRNNMRNVALAIENFEATNGRYPGYLESVGGQGVSWVVRLLPQMDRVELYDLWTGQVRVDDDVDVDLTPRLEVLICPSDPPDDPSAPVNSYVINAGIRYKTPGEEALLDRPDEQKTRHLVYSGIAHNHAGKGLKTNSDTVSGGDGKSNTLIVAENMSNAHNVAWAAALIDEHPKAANVFVWHPVSQRDAISDLWKINGIGESFSSLGEVPPVIDGIAHGARPSSYHTGGVNVAFCDAHAIFLRDDIEYRVYMQLMTPDGRQSFMSTLPDEYRYYVLNQADYQ